MTDWRTEKVAEHREKQRVSEEQRAAREAEEQERYQSKFTESLLMLGIPGNEVADALNAARVHALVRGLPTTPSALFMDENGTPDLLLQPVCYVSYGNVDLIACKPCVNCGRWVAVEQRFDPRPGFSDIGWVLERDTESIYHECGAVEGDKNFRNRPVVERVERENEPPTNEHRIATALETIANVVGNRWGDSCSTCGHTRTAHERMRTGPTGRAVGVELASCLVCRTCEAFTT